MTKLFDLIESKCPENIIKPKNQHYDYVYLSISIEDNFTIEQINSFLLFCIPTKVLFISIEGVVPLALLRSRRHKNMKEIQFNEFIKFFIETHQEVDVIFSDTNVAGSSNQKILDFVRKQKECIDFPIYSTHCFISNSFPFQFLSLHLIKSVGFIPNKNIMFDLIPTTLSLLETYKIKVSDYSLSQLIDDIVILSTITENDVIFPVNEINIDGLLAEYCSLIKSTKLSLDGIILKRNIGQIFIGAREQRLKEIRIKDSEKVQRRNGEGLELKQINYENDRVADKVRCDLLKIRGSNRELKKSTKCVSTSASSLNSDIICQMYWKGIEWCCLSIFNGVPDWDWYYPFNVSPEISDLIKCNEENTFSLGRPVHPLTYQVLISSEKTKLPTSIEWLNSSRSEFYEFFKNPHQIDILKIITFLTKSKLCECPNSIRWGWNEIITKKQFEEGVLIPNESKNLPPSQIDVITSGSRLSFPQNNIEGSIVQCFNSHEQDTSSLPRYGFIEPWYSENYIFYSRIEEEPQRVLEQEFNERKRKRCVNVEEKESKQNIFI